MTFVILSGLLVAVLGIPEEKVHATFNQLDKVKDGVLRMDDLLVLFESIDTNRDGFLSHEEFTAATTLGQSRVFFPFYDKLDGTEDHKASRLIAEIMLSRLDHDSNGEVPYLEFKHTYPRFYADVMKQLKHFAA